MGRHAAGVLAAAGVLLGSGLLGGCGVFEETGSGDCDGLADDCSHLVDVRGAHAHFSVRVPDTWGIGAAREDAACDSVYYRFDDLPDGWGRMRVEAVPTDCEVAEANSSIGNGQHGLYRTLEDVPEPEDVDTMTTALGEAAVFVQEYFECTNECERWDEPVAIITLDDPVDPAYPTLVLRGEQDRLSRGDLEEILGALEESYPPPSASPSS